MSRFPVQILATLILASALLCQDTRLASAQHSASQSDVAIYSQPRATVLAGETESSSQAQPESQLSTSFPSLRPRETATGEPGAAEESSKISAPSITVISSLAIVLGLFAALVWVSRRFGSGNVVKGGLPKDVMQPLGSTALDARTRVSLLRCGNRILVVAQSASGVQPLCEIDHPDEVRQLTAACLGDSRHDFASTLSEIEREKPESGYAGKDQSKTASPRSRQRLFASA